MAMIQCAGLSYVRMDHRATRHQGLPQHARQLTEPELHNIPAARTQQTQSPLTYRAPPRPDKGQTKHKSHTQGLSTKSGLLARPWTWLLVMMIGLSYS